MREYLTPESSPEDVIRLTWRDNREALLRHLMREDDIVQAVANILAPVPFFYPADGLADTEMVTMEVVEYRSTWTYSKDRRRRLLIVHGTYKGASLRVEVHPL